MVAHHWVGLSFWNVAHCFQHTKSMYSKLRHPNSQIQGNKLVTIAISPVVIVSTWYLRNLLIKVFLGEAWEKIPQVIRICKTARTVYKNKVSSECRGRPVEDIAYVIIIIGNTSTHILPQQIHLTCLLQCSNLLPAELYHAHPLCTTFTLCVEFNFSDGLHEAGFPHVVTLGARLLLNLKLQVHCAVEDHYRSIIEEAKEQWRLQAHLHTVLPGG